MNGIISADRSKDTAAANADAEITENNALEAVLYVIDNAMAVTFTPRP